MENASKALIIAASVLIAILLIAMGVAIFNKAQSSYDTTSLDATEINMFNSKFERYSDKQLGSQVKSLLSFAISNASTNGDDPVKIPTVTDGTNTASGGTDATSDISNYVKSLGTIRNGILSTHTYTINLEYGSTGLINKITINN